MTSRQQPVCFCCCGGDDGDCCCCCCHHHHHRFQYNKNHDHMMKNGNDHNQQQQQEEEYQQQQCRRGRRITRRSCSASMMMMMMLLLLLCLLTNNVVVTTCAASSSSSSSSWTATTETTTRRMIGIAGSAIKRRPWGTTTSTTATRRGRSSSTTPTMDRTSRRLSTTTTTKAATAAATVIRSAATTILLRGGSTEATTTTSSGSGSSSSSNSKKKKSSKKKKKKSTSSSSSSTSATTNTPPNNKEETNPMEDNTDDERSTTTAVNDDDDEETTATKAKNVHDDVISGTPGGDGAGSTTTTTTSNRNVMKVFSYGSTIGVGDDDDEDTTRGGGGDVVIDGGHSVVGMTESSLEMMSLFEGDTVLIRGKRGKKMIGTVAYVNDDDITAFVDIGSSSHNIHQIQKPPSTTTTLHHHNKDDATTTTTTTTSLQQQEQQYIGMSPDAMRNCGIRAGDTVTVIPAPNVKFGKAVLILPFDDSLSMAGIDIHIDNNNNYIEEANIFNDYIKPYFEGKFRALSRGDCFQIHGPLGVLEFQCIEIDTDETDNDIACIVTDDTIIECDGEPIHRNDYLLEDDLHNAGYDVIGGASKHLASIRELVELPLRHPELWNKLGINRPRGVLLTGPPGSGKTSMARAVAAETGAYFFIINGPEVISKRSGESETNLRRAFEDAMNNADEYNGAILFIDEIDSIAPRRDKAGGEVEKRIVSQLLTLMDGLTKSSSRLVVIAATNRPSVIEPALRRPGRFDRELDMGIPDELGRLEILQIKTRDMRLGTNVDLELLARNTHGYVGADIQQLCMEAALECIRSKIPYVDFHQNHIDKHILDSIIVEEKHFDYALGIVAPSSLRENQVEIPNVLWNDVGGLDDVKRELHETVQYPVEHADKYIKFGMNPSKGVLFYGPPGCGKTLLAKAIANECGANFISIKGPELLTQWFGESEANVRELFDKARAASPCILMFDELDSIAKTRGSGGPGASEAGDRVINQILTEIDGVGARKNVFVIGATNRPDILDPAVIRPGRLDQLIYIPLPDLKSRIAIFKAQLRKAPLDPAVNIEVLARSTHGFSGADIAEICTTASKLAIREAILQAEERIKKIEAGEIDIDDDEEDSSSSQQEMVGGNMLIGKRHFNFAMSRARKSVSEKDLALFDEFAEKQKLGRGESATNFKFSNNDDDDDTTTTTTTTTTVADDNEDLYS